MIAVLAALAAAAAQPDWTVHDTTNNDTGERTVEALNLYIEGDDYVALWMRCIGRQPTIGIEWDDLPTAKYMVFELSATGQPFSYGRFEMTFSNDDVHHGMTVDEPARFVSVVSGRVSATLTAHVPTRGPLAIVIPMKGTREAWTRVSENCESDV